MFTAATIPFGSPAGNTPLTATLLVELLLEAGLPEGLIGLLHGGGSTVGQWLLESPIPAFYAFTGSTAACSIN